MDKRYQKKPELYVREVLLPACSSCKFIHDVPFENAQNHRRRGQIDFVIFHTKGILVLEVKGGHPKRIIKDVPLKKNETVSEIKEEWEFYHDVEQKELHFKMRFSTPFSQCIDNLESLRQQLIAIDPKYSKICFAHGLIFPDADLNRLTSRTNINTNIIFDNNSSPEDFEEYVDTCFKEELSKDTAKNYDNLSSDDFEVLKEHLLPAYEANINSYAGVRDHMVKRLKENLYGPAWDEADLTLNLPTSPLEVYTTGIIHGFKVDDATPSEPDPPKDTVDQNLELEQSEWVDSKTSNLSKGSHNKDFDEEEGDISQSFSSIKPQSFGIFFRTQLTTKIHIQYGYSFYDKNESGYYIQTKILDTQEVKDFDEPIILGDDGKNFIELRIQHYKISNERFVGVYLCNTSDSFYYQGSAFQCGLKVILSNGLLIPQNEQDTATDNAELFQNNMNYGVGKGVAVDWNEDLSEIWSEFIPTHDVLAIQSRSTDNVNLDLDYLGDPEDSIADKEYFKNLRSFASSYKDHLEGLKSENLNSAQENNLKRALIIQSRILSAIDLLESNDTALTAFKLMNLTFLSTFAREIGYEGDYFYSFPDDESHSKPAWRMFQLAFCLASMPGMIDPDKYKEERETVDLIWFPTGGGKTEAYLALLSFTLYYRRLLNPKNAGVTAIMRYTLRLLVLDQFNRLARLITVMEHIRITKFKNLHLGDIEISLGLWVGIKSSPRDIDSAIKMVNDRYQKNDFALDSCPWCKTDLLGSGIDNGYKERNLKKYGKPLCPNKDCGFADDSNEPLPIYLFENSVFANCPSVIIGTVDNFAKLSWENYPTANIFGINAKDFDPPDLIVQDELHLISGPLGSLVGLYDQLVRDLCSTKFPVKIVASTATISNAKSQISLLYGARNYAIIPPPEITFGESFFMTINKDRNKSRKYVGIFGASTSPIESNIKTASALLQASCFRDDGFPVNEDFIDPYRTLLWYFNSIRELGYAISSRWVLESRINFLTNNLDLRLGNKRKRQFQFAELHELTSRRTPKEIRDIRNSLDNTFKYLYDKGMGRAVDILFATNMVSVGIDIPRLGLMMVNGLPKTTSEYIQATSRVGRKFPGLVVTVYSANKSRDRSHYEYFHHLHDAIYKHVEPTSVTPFSAGAREKGLSGLLIAYLLHFIPKARPSEYSSADLHQGKNWIMDQLQLTETDQTTIDRVDGEIESLIDRWIEELPANWGKMVRQVGDTSKTLAGSYLGESKKKYHLFDVLGSLRNVDRDVSIEVIKKEY